MNPKDLQSAYVMFFEKSEAGQNFMTELARLRADNQEKAEKEPRDSLAFTQRAAGVREVLDHIKAISSEHKKGDLPKSTI